jgi:phosphoribosylformimino-5-aminoimidazole carboxamide ribotide isomerase
LTIPVIASGGVAGPEDIDRLKAVLPHSKKGGGGIAGVIAGRALYDGRLDLRSAITALKAA